MATPGAPRFCIGHDIGTVHVAGASAPTVVIASPNIAQQALQLGLLDEIAISLAPVLLGDGIPFFAKHDVAPIVLTDPDVCSGLRVTHLRFRVK